jgi:uncharacterized membrane protein
MVLHYPIWLLLAIPLAVSMRVWRLPSRLLRVLRVAALVLILLAMCAPAVRLPSRAGIVVVVADRSHSMPPGSDETMKETVGLLEAGMVPGERLGVVSFGEGVAIEQPPQRGKFTGFITDVGRDGSNLAEAIDTAVALIPPRSPGRILVLSDGRWTGSDPSSATARVAARGVAVDFRLLQRSSADDVAIVRLDAPGTVTPGESFVITAWVHAPTPQEVTYELVRGDRRLAAGTKQLPSGTSRILFRDMAEQPGTHQYRLRVTGDAGDPVPENNAAKILVGVHGPRPMLCVTSASEAGLARLLEAGGMDVRVEPTATRQWSLEELSNYSAVLVENVPAGEIGQRGMETIAAWVRETGSGLMLTGGRSAYGPGGYYKSPLEPVMPVSMELRREHRKLALAIVVALDRSGSMAMPVGIGKTKMDLANLAAAEVLNMLGPLDEFGVVAVDSLAHVVSGLAPVKDRGAIRSKILRIQSMGGGIFIYEALSASARMLLGAQAGTRHIILFADAADSEEPGKYEELIAKCRGSNMTVSVIGLGTPADQDADLLRDIAARGGGRCFFTTNAGELPRLFAQDTIVVARSAFLDEQTAIRPTGGLVALAGRQFEAPPPVGGYNLCYLRPGASLAVVTTDEYKAPVVAAWQAGVGRVLCYTGEADGEYTGPIASWPDVGAFFTSMARWVAGGLGSLPGNMLLTQDVEHGVCVIQLHLDPERETETLAEPPSVRTLRGLPGAPPTADETRTMQWTSADTLAVEVPLHGSETTLSTVDVAGIGQLSLVPVCLPYSPEFKLHEGGAGAVAMERLARATGGRERVNLAAIWKELPRRPRLVELGHWLLVVALAVFLVEVLERRTGFLSTRRRRVVPEEAEEEAQAPAPRRVKRVRPKGRRRAAPAKPLRKKEVAAPPAEEEEPDMTDALRRARRKARERMQH